MGVVKKSNIDGMPSYLGRDRQLATAALSFALTSYSPFSEVKVNWNGEKVMLVGQCIIMMRKL